MVIVMIVVNSNCNNLASILMGKQIQFGWRGQNNVIITVPYDEWLQFIQRYKVLLKYRKPLDYEKMLMSKDVNVSIRYFLYDMSWALYSELACSSNVGKDATLILPHFDGGRTVTITEIVKSYYTLGDDMINHYHSSLKAITRNYYGLVDDADLQYGLVNVSNLSEWNSLIYKICIYLQSKSSNKNVTEKINIDWRIS